MMIFRDHVMSRTQEGLRRPTNAIIVQRILPHYRKALFEALCRRQDVTFFIVADPGDAQSTKQLLDEGQRKDVRFLSAPLKIIQASRSVLFYWQPDAVRAVLRSRPEVVIAEGTPYSITAWLLGLIAPFRGYSFFLWSHGLLEPEHGIKWRLRCCLYRLADRLLLYGDYAKSLLVAKRFESDKLSVVYNSLDYERQLAVAESLSDEACNRFRAGLGVGEGERLVSFVGRLQPIKRLDLLLVAIARLRSQGKVVHAALVGDGPERLQLASLAERLGVSGQIHFLGASYDEKYIGLVYSASDLSVIPSGAGLSVIHAMGYGIPVLLHDEAAEHGPEWEAVIQDVTGFFYRHGDLDHLIDCMSNALFPHPRKHVMGEACRSLIRQRYTPEKQADAFAKAVSLGG